MDRMVFTCILFKKKYTVYELMDYNYYCFTTVFSRFYIAIYFFFFLQH